MVESIPAFAKGLLLEREQEVEILRQALVSAGQGNGRLLLIEGPAGVGKSRLLKGAQSLAAESGMATLVAQGTELERDFEFSVVRQLFAPSLLAVDASRRQQLLSGAAGLASPVFEMGIQPVASDQGFALIQGLFWLTSRLAFNAEGETSDGLLLAIDDAQWSDRSSLRFLVHLAIHLEELPVVVVVVVRSGEPGATDELLDQLRARPETQLLHPSPLSEQAVEQLVRESFGEKASPDFARACARATAGNPFYLKELFNSLRAELSVADLPTANEISGVVPEVVQNSLAVRLAHVPPAAIALASAAAILSDGTPLRQVAALAELDAEVAEQAADVLSAANILAQGEPITFIHPLIAAAVQAGMTPFARARAHRRAASLLAREGSSSQQVATHLLAARPDGDQWVVGQLREAAGVALRRGAPKTAIRLLSRALAEPPLSDTRTEVLIELAQAKAADGSAEAIDHLTVAVETLQDPRRRAQVYQDLSRLLLTQGNLSGAAEVARRAINELPAADPLVRGLLADYLSAAVLYGPLRADAVSRLQPIIRSAALGQLPEESTLSALAAVQAACTCEPSGLVRSLVDAALVNDPLVDGKSHGGVGLSAVAVALLKVDELELAEQVLDRAIEVSQRHGRMIALGFASTWRSHVHYHRGRLVDAVTDAERALDLAQDGWKWYVSRAAPALIQAHIERGDLNSARAVLQRKDRASSENLTHALLFEARGHLALMEDDPAAALEEFQAAQSHLERFQVFHPGYCGWQRGAAIANARLGRDQEATALAESALALARRLGIPRPLGQALYTAGLVTSGQSAVELLSEAVAVLEHSAAALHLAHALVELGAALRRSGNRVAAREPLRRGLELAQLFTALPLVEQAKAELRAAGSRPRRTALSGISSLTPGERRIIELAARGNSNPEIAQALFVTLKTVKWHLGNAFQKLQITSRQQLSAILETDDVYLQASR